jgi:hypothetical protein
MTLTLRIKVNSTGQGLDVAKALQRVVFNPSDSDALATLAKELDGLPVTSVDVSQY